MASTLRIATILILLVTALAMLLARRRAIWDTTLVACWWWTVAALAALAAALVIGAVADMQGAGLESMRFAAAVGTFCPVVSVLGAKRPQDRAWNFVVLSLWLMLALPAAEAAFLNRGQSLEIHGARGWFLWALIGLGVSIWLPTRFWLACLLVAAGQILLMARHLPVLHQRLLEGSGAWSMAAFAAAVLAALLARKPSERGMDRVWLDFRDSFGALWALRVLQRVNAVAEAADWPVRLTWAGFQGTTADGNSFDDLPADTRRALDRAMHNLLRRFVSDAWIASRASEPLD